MKMRHPSGWRGELERHRLSRMGIRTTQRPMITYGAKPKVIVVDIDGTIMNVSKRWNMAKQVAKPPSRKFWDVFMNPNLLKYDEPIAKTADALQTIKKMGFDIVYLSGRRSTLREQTEKQLKQHGFPRGTIILRKKGKATEPFKIGVITRLKQTNNVGVYIGDEADDVYVGKEAKVHTVRVKQNQPWDVIARKQINKRLKKAANI